MVMERNGDDRWSQLEARVRELELAVRHITEGLDHTWRPRLIELEENVEELRGQLQLARELDD